MDYKSLVDPELKKFAIKMPYNKAFIFGDKLSHGLMSRFAKTTPKASKRTVTVKGYKGLEFRTDIFEPRNTQEKLPALIFIHGGAFSYRAASYHVHLAAAYAVKAGCRVFFPDYHLLPDYPWPAAWHDILALYRCITADPESFRIDPEKIGITGDSAGAFLAETLCNSYEKESLKKPCLQMLVYPCTDYDPERDSMKKNAEAPIWDLKSHKRMMQYYFRGMQPSEIKALMPMQQELPENIPDTYIETAEFDILRDEGIQYAKRLEAAGAAVEVNETAGTFHGYDIAINSKVARMNIEKRFAFLKRAFG